MKNISIIVAIAQNNEIGRNNKRLWDRRADMKRFRQITLGHTVIMGRNTFLSLPGGPLKNRRNVVISDNLSESFEGCEMVYSIREALEKCDPGGENFVIGGASVYRQILPLANRLYITRVNKPFEADTFFPEIDPVEWEVVSQESPEPDGKNDFSYTFITFQRKN